MNRNYEEMEQLRTVVEDANEFIAERVRKLTELENRGINPYPYSFEHVIQNRTIKDKFDSYTENDCMRVAGRVMLFRKMGSVTFLTIRDQSGDLQIYLNKSHIREETYGLLRLIDTGDILGFDGTVFRTKTGEITIKADRLHILSKAIRPLPEKFHGIQDADLKVRHRSVDMLMNNDVKERFINRARAMSAIREFMDGLGFIEAETPILDTKYGGGEAKPFETHVNALGIDVFMNVSPELYLKRLLVGGIERVYTIGRSFRNEGIDRTHYPEFTLFECYMAYTDYHGMMELMEQLYEFVFTKINHTTIIQYDGHEIDFKAPWKRERMCDLVKAATEIDVEWLTQEQILTSIVENSLLTGLVREGLNLSELTKGDLITTLFDEYCVAALIQPTFVMDFPVESSPLCKVHRENPELIERFEPYANGMELGNAYSELNDALRQRELLLDQAGKLRAGFETASPMDEEFAVSIDIGMPPAGGLGIGIDRMMMFLTNAYSIKDVIAFPLVKR